MLHALSRSSHPRMHRCFRAPAAVGLAFLLGGCALFRSNLNAPLDPVAIAQLEPGTTTAHRAVELLGAPAQVIQLGDRSAYRYDHEVTKGAGLILVLLIIGNVDTREDRTWLFFDEDDVLSHVATSLEAHRAQYAMPWEDIHEAEDDLEADRDRGVAPAEER